MRRRAIATLALCLLAAAPSGCATAVSAFQPELGDTIVLWTTDDGGTAHRRLLTPIEREGRLYVSANHWPRAWYRRALSNPEVRVTRDGHTSDYRAVPVSAQEREHLLDDSGFPWVGYLFTGFAPREFLRLDPRQAASVPTRR